MRVIADEQETGVQARGATRPTIALACSATMYERCFSLEALARIESIGTVIFEPFEEPSSWTEPPPYNADAEARLIMLAKDKDVLVIGPGAPRITAAILDAAPNIRFVGELEGDRFARRIDLDAAAQRGVKTVDTSHGSSYPVSEWALALSLIGLRNAGDLFRRLIAGEELTREWKKTQIGFHNGELAGKRVGIIGCGYIGRHLIELLAPFKTINTVYDPYAPRVLADVLDFDFCSLEHLFSRSDVVVCTLPLTDETQGLIGAKELALLPSGSVFVNVGRGAVVDTAALIARLAQGDVLGCLDVMDPEPIPTGSPLRAMSNVFLTPHIAGVTAQAGPRFVTLMAEEIERHFRGLELRSGLVQRQQQQDTLSFTLNVLENPFP